MTSKDALPVWLIDPALASCWPRVQARFEQAGCQAQGRVRVATPDRDARRAVGDLVGRTVTGDAAQLDLAALDARLRERSGVGGLAEVLTAYFGRAPVSRPDERRAAAQAREGPLRVAAELADLPGVGPWAGEWVAQLRRTGLLTNRPHATEAVRQAVAVLAQLTSGDASARGAYARVELAARLLGDAHGLDADRLAEQLAVRGLAAASGQPLPANPREREELWRRFGVEPDLLSRTCLVWRVAALDHGPTARRINLAASSGDPVHLTGWDLRRVDGLAAIGDRVLICENPRVLEAIAQAQVPRWGVVCVAGEPNLVTDQVLDLLVESGVGLHYHGDFDWAGVGIANRVIERTGARPWHLDARDYVDAVRPDAPKLAGPPVEPSWDGELGAAMRARGRALHEESVLPQLLAELRAQR